MSKGKYFVEICILNQQLRLVFHGQCKFNQYTWSSGSEATSVESAPEVGSEAWGSRGSVEPAPSRPKSAARRESLRKYRYIIKPILIIFGQKSGR